MNQKRRKFEVWSAISIALLLAFLLFFVYPICTLLKQAFTTSESAFTFDNFIKFSVSLTTTIPYSTASRCLSPLCWYRWLSALPFPISIPSTG